MGLLDPNALQQTAPPPPPEGMMSAPPQQAPLPHYNGIVSYEGNPIEVKNSVAMVDGEKYIVSDDGKIVVNMKREFVGTIQNGKFLPATPELIDQFQKQGIFESEQPQGTPAQTAQ